MSTRARVLAVMTAAALVAGWTGSAAALDVVRLGKAVPNSFAFGAAEVGIQAKIYEQEGIDLKVLSFAGDARLQQALAADGIDVAVGSGPGLGFRAKGVPAIGVAAMYGRPSNLSLTVLSNSRIKTVADLKGARIGVTTFGSLTDWLTRELSKQQGWGPNGIKVEALGGVPERLAAAQRGELDGLVIESGTGFELEDQGKGRNVLLFGDIEQHFYTHVIYATDAMIAKQPDLLRRFLRAWFKTIAYMRAHKDITVKSESKTIDVRESVASKIYDTQINDFSSDGAWDPVAIDVIRNSLKDLGILNFVPEAKSIYNDQFVPVKF